MSSCSIIQQENVATKESHPDTILRAEDIQKEIFEPETEVDVSNFETLVYVLYSISFITVALCVFEATIFYEINTAIKTEFSGYSNNTVFDVDSAERFFVWFKEMVNYAYQTKFYEGRLRPPRRAPEIAYANYYVSPVRLTQRRIKLKAGESSDFFNYTPKVWVSGGFGAFSSTDKNEDKTSFGPDNRYVYTTDGRLPGFRALVDLYAENVSTAISSVEDLQDNKWVGLQTTSVLADFVLYNPHVKIYTYAIVVLSFTETGRISVTLSLVNSWKQYYGLEKTMPFRAFCEIVFMLVLAFYLVCLPKNFYKTYKHVLEERADREFIARRGQVRSREQEAEEAGHSAFKKCWLKVWYVLQSLGLTVYEYFSVLWNLLDTISYGMSLGALIVWLQFVITYSSFTLTRSDFSKVETNDLFFYSSQLLSTLKSLCALNMIIIFVRILKCLSAYVTRLSVLFDTVSKAKSELLAFLIIFSMLVFAFVLLLYVYSGRTLKMFAGFGSSLYHVFVVINQSFEPLNAVMNGQEILVYIFVVIYLVIFFFVLMNLLFGFLRRAYREADKDMERKYLGLDLRNKKVRFSIDTHWTLRLRTAFMRVLAMCFRKYKTKLETEAKERAEYTQLLKTHINSEDKDFDIEYNPFHFFSDEKTKLPLTSLYIEERHNMERERRCGTIFYSALGYAAFMAIFIGVVVAQTHIEMVFPVVRSQIRRLDSDARFNMTADGETMYVFSQIADLEYLTTWLVDGLPQFARTKSSEDAIYEHIVNQECRVTFRLGKPLPGTPPLDRSHARLARDTSIWTKLQPDERTTPFEGPNSKMRYEYQPGGGFLGRGGYVVYWPALRSNLTESAQSFVLDGIIGPDMWFLFIDFLSYQLPTEYFIYNTIVIELRDTGKIVKVIYDYPVRLHQYSSAGDYVRAVFEGIWIVLLGYMIVRFVLNIKEKWVEYKNWYSVERIYLTSTQRYLRFQKTPGLLRKLRYVINVFRLLDMVIFTLSIIAIVTWIYHIATASALLKKLPFDRSEIDYLEAARRTISLFRDYCDYCSLIALLIGIRMIEYLEHAGAMQILIASLQSSGEDVCYYMIILFSLMLGFVASSHIGFGPYSPNYATFTASWLTCLQLMVGDMDSSEIYANDPATAAVYYIAFVLIFSFTFLSIFFAILEKNLHKATEDYLKLSVKIRPQRALLCCCYPPPDIGPQSEIRKRNPTLVEAINQLQGIQLQLRAYSPFSRLH